MLQPTMYPSNSMVSVWMIAYNQEQYISQALESVLMQKVDFRLELIIGEDCSTDGTRAIIESYRLKFPYIISPIYHEHNVGAFRNAYEFTLPRCQGKYIACLEGDDYWIDPNKLQKQVDFLEKNQEFGMVCTDYSKYFELTKRHKSNIFKNPKYIEEVKFEDYLLDMSSIGTATVLLRSELVKRYLDEISVETRSEFIVGDTPFWLFIAAKSKIAVMPDETAVYRIRENSACHFKSPEDHYRFVEQGFSIADYFFARYAYNNPDLGEKLEMKKLKAAMFHAFRMRDKELAHKVYRSMHSHKVKVKQKIKAFIMLKGAGNRIVWYAANLLLKVR